MYNLPSIIHNAVKSLIFNNINNYNQVSDLPLLQIKTYNNDYAGWLQSEPLTPQAGEYPLCKGEYTQGFLFACYCGLRVGDVTDLRWGDISVNGGRHFVSVVMQKNSKPISLPLPVKALSWLPERGEPES